MATPHLDHLQYLKSLAQTQVTSASLKVSINGTEIQTWLEQALVPYLRTVWSSWLQQIADTEKPQAVSEVDAAIASNEQQHAQLLALKDTLT